MTSLLTFAQQNSGYLNYVYSYPHKTAYRAFPKPLALKEVWAEEDRSRLFLYLHLPFCEMRCGYCNLFTLSQPSSEMVTDYLTTLERQMQQIAASLGSATQFAQLAMGGGTPTYLTAKQLDQLFLQMEQHLGARKLPASVEVSPATVNMEKLACLREHGVQRISIGIESWDTADLKALGRPQKLDQVHQALQWIRDSQIARLNIDLIYGNRSQTPQSWLASLAQAVSWQPEEIFIYPLYIRPLTGLGRKSMGQQPDQRPLLYQLAYQYLLAAGYQAQSMRSFVRCQAVLPPGQYRCQEDGMVGIGAGARSYTRRLHYASRYAVGQTSIKNLLAAYNASTDHTLQHTDYGIVLNADEQRRRYLLLSLLQSHGVEYAAYHQRFGSIVLHDFPQLTELIELNWACTQTTALTLTPEGMAQSDLIGHWLFSTAVQQRMQQWIAC